jgi:hypothetical protein
MAEKRALYMGRLVDWLQRFMGRLNGMRSHLGLSSSWIKERTRFDVASCQLAELDRGIGAETEGGESSVGSCLSRDGRKTSISTETKRDERR